MKVMNKLSSKRDFFIKLATTKDMDRVVKIANQVHSYLASRRSSFFGRAREFSKSKTLYSDLFKKENNRFFVAKRWNSEVIGYVYIIIENQPDDLITIPYASIEEIAFDKRYRHWGVGKALMDRAGKWALAKNQSYTACNLGI